MAQQFFNGSPVDPKFVIDRFRELLKLLPKAPKLPIPPKRRIPPPKTFPDKPPVKLQGKGGKHIGITIAAKVLSDNGYSKKEIDEFKKRLGSRRIAGDVESLTPEQVKDRVLSKFKVVMEYDTPKDEEKEEKHPIADDIDEDNVDEDADEKVASAHTDLLRNKASRLSKILQTQYNWKSESVVPTKGKKNLYTEFMKVYPDEEGEVIAAFEPELQAIKVKNDEADAQGTQKKSLEADELLEKMTKLANKRITIKRQLEKIAAHMVAPPEITAKLKANPRGKVQIKGPGRGKKTKKPNDIETIKVVI